MKNKKVRLVANFKSSRFWNCRGVQILWNEICSPACFIESCPYERDNATALRDVFAQIAGFSDDGDALVIEEEEDEDDE